MNLNLFSFRCSSFRLSVSVPARGIMNLNKDLNLKYISFVCFRPRSGNYESECIRALDDFKRFFVSVPARGIMNLNVASVFDDATAFTGFRPRSGNYESEFSCI